MTLKEKAERIRIGRKRAYICLNHYNLTYANPTYVESAFYLIGKLYLLDEDRFRTPVDFYVYWSFQGGKHIISSCHCPSLSFRSTNSRCAVCRLDMFLLRLFSIPLSYYIMTIWCIHRMAYYAHLKIACLHDELQDIQDFSMSKRLFVSKPLWPKEYECCNT